MSDMTPVSRLEYFLAKIVGDNVELPEPQTDVELYLAAVAGETVELPPPASRWTLYLAKILGQNVALPVPQSRADLYLAKIAGEDVELPPLPLTRSEAYLALWAENGSGWSWETVTGVSPLTLANAVAHAIRKLVQYGKCSTSGGDIYCNNGKLVAVDDELPEGYQRQIGFEFAANAYFRIPGFHLRGSDTVRISFSVDKACNVFGCYTDTSSADNYSLYSSTAAGAKYLRYDGETYNSSIPSSQFGNRLDVVITPTGTTGMPTDSVITPATFESVADLCIGTTSQSASSSKLDGCIWGNFEVDNRLTLIPVKRLSDNVLGYYDPDSDTLYEPIGSAPVSLGVDTSHLTVLSVVGTPEVLTIGNQTATVQNLFEVGGVADEQDIISGVITRKVEVSVSGGVITLSALATPVIEHTTPQPLSTVEGDNTLSWTAEVSGTVKEVEYAYIAPSFEWKTASGAVVSVNDAIAGEVGALSVSINPVQTGSGDPSPANVRPISGWTGLSVFRGGDNAFDADAYSTINGYIDANGKIVTSSGGAKTIWFPISPNTDYTIGIKAIAHITGTPAGSDDVQVGLFSTIPALNVVGTRIYAYNRPDVYTDYYHTVEFNSGGASYIAIKIGVQSKTDINASIATLVVIETATLASEIVNWQSSAGTVYGGTLDVLTGVLTARPYYASYNGETLVGPWVSSMDKYVAGTTPTTGAQVVDLGGTPTTVQLTPAQVSTLLGTNVIWASGNGEISVTYRAEASE